MLFFTWNWSSFLSLVLGLSLLSTPMWTLKLSRKKKESAFLLLFFISKSPCGYATYRFNAWVLEMQNFTPAYSKGWRYVRTYPVPTTCSEPRFVECIDYQIFLPNAMVLRRARESSAITQCNYCSLRLANLLTAGSRYCLL